MDDLSPDINRPLDLKQCSEGWKSQKEYSYWVPGADIVGRIPDDLFGTFFRNGPGVNEVYGIKLKHPIDGDGMVCAVTFQNGRVHFKSKFVESKHHREEREQRKLLYVGQMGTKSTSILRSSASLLTSFLQGKFPRIKFRNPSNTNSFYWGGKLITCYETGIPHCLDPYSLETLGPDDLNGALELKALAAHFRIDAEKERIVCISVRPGFRRAPCLGIYEFDRRWRLCQKQLHHIEGLNYSHDFILLPDYYVFHMTPFVTTSMLLTVKILSGWSSPGEEMKYFPGLPSRFVIIPRTQSRLKSQGIIQVDTDPCHIFHFGTASQDGDKIKFCAVCLDTKFNMSFDNEVWLSNTSVSPGRMYNFTIDLPGKTCTRVQADTASCEFPFSHPYRHGMPGTRYNYLMASARPGYNLPYRDIVKFDAAGNGRQVWYSHGCIGEPVFAPRHGYESCKIGDEDDGYVIVQLYVPEKKLTEFCVLDAKDLSKGPLARIKLKHHIPYGFHGTFTPEVFVMPPVLKAKL
ncbi:apocarotenoid-15,15'-oxygenase [Nematostella vectensis]|uniref:apocarotenoid-15,15'-oxygenase n=1 Tax=Nematostella vectensis TaxID=45351 RepID=UPI0020773F47|nr:apocarotenoid-15,15'-oxygenase [Nematostella vectensis]